MLLSFFLSLLLHVVLCLPVVVPMLPSRPNQSLHGAIIVGKVGSSSLKVLNWYQGCNLVKRQWMWLMVHKPLSSSYFFHKGFVWNNWKHKFIMDKKLSELDYLEPARNFIDRGIPLVGTEMLLSWMCNLLLINCILYIREAHTGYSLSSVSHFKFHHFYECKFC